MSQKRLFTICGVISGLVALMLVINAWRTPNPRPSENGSGTMTKDSTKVLNSFDPAPYLQMSNEPSALCKKILTTPLYLVKRADVASLSAGDRAYLIGEYLRTPDPGRRVQLVRLLYCAPTLEAGRLFKWSLEQEYFTRTIPLSDDERRFPEHLVSGLGQVAIQEPAVLPYLKHLANPWNILDLMSPEWPQPTPPIDIAALIAYRAMVAIGASGQPEADGMLLELRNSAMVDPTQPEGKGRSLAWGLLIGAQAWDGYQQRVAANPNWMNEGTVETTGEPNFELAREAREKWAQTPRGREWMDWYNALPPDQR